MTLLAVISDKTPTILGMWLGTAIITAIFAFPASRRLWLALVAMVLVVFWSVFAVRGVYHECYLEGIFSDRVWRELGLVWVINSFASACMPGVVVTAVTIATWRREMQESRIKRGLCPNCAYPVGTSEVCTECGGKIPSAKRELPACDAGAK